MTRERSIRLLFVQWAIIAAVPVVLFTLQTVAGKYGDDSELAWNWLVGQFAPSLSILIAAVFSDPSTRWRGAPANAWKWRWAFWIGNAQGAALLLVILAEPLLGAEPFDLFGRTQVMLALLQGLAVAAVGAVIFDGR